MVPIDDLKTTKNKVKIHSSDQIATLAGMIVEFGFGVPLLVGKDNEIIAGRGRWLAGKSLGLKELPCVRVTHLSDMQVRALMLADNRVAISPWDMPELKMELNALKEFDETLLGLTGFDFSELDQILQGILTEESSDKDDPLPKVHFLSVGGHKVELTAEEKNDLSSIFSAWSKHHEGYRGLARSIIDAARSYGL